LLWHRCVLGIDIPFASVVGSGIYFLEKKQASILTRKFIEVRRDRNIYIIEGKIMEIQVDRRAIEK